MLADVVKANPKAAELINADGIIPSGEMMLKLSKKIDKVHRDTFHASYGAGRYALALLWLRTLCGVDVSSDPLTEFDEPVSEKEKEELCAVANSFEPIKFIK